MRAIEIYNIRNCATGFQELQKATSQYKAQAL
jgi:hypothetical protein